MKIESLSQLKKLLALCRQQGVNIIKVDGMEIVLEGIPQVSPSKISKTSTLAPGGITEDTKVIVDDVIKTDGLTDEDLLFYSAGGNQ